MISIWAQKLAMNIGNTHFLMALTQIVLQSVKKVLQIFIWIKRIYWISPASPWNSTTVITVLVPFTDICCYGVMFLFIAEKVTGMPKVIDPFKTQIWKKFLKSCLFEFLKWQSDYTGWQKKHGTLPNIPLVNTLSWQFLKFLVFSYQTNSSRWEYLLWISSKMVWWG